MYAQGFLDCNHCRLFIEPPLVIKDLERKTLEKLSADECLSVARSILTQVARYYSVLHDAGLPVPPHHEVRLAQEPDGCHVYEEMTLGRVPEVNEQTIRAILRRSLPVLIDPSLGLDMDPANFIELDGDEQSIAFCDFVPARYRDDKGVFLVGFPQPADDGEVKWNKKRYYDPCGMIRRLRFHLTRQTRQDWTDFLIKETGEISFSLGQEVRSFFAALPTETARFPLSSSSRDQIAALSDPDDIRDVAIRLAGTIPGVCQHVMELTHVDYRTDVQQRLKNLEMAKVFLLSTK